MIKKLLAAWLMLSSLLLTAQTNPPQKLVLQMPDQSFGGSNGASVVWHPVQKKYVASFAGNTSYPIAVFDEKGKRLSNDAEQCNYDVRGLWYNPDKQQIQGNAYNDGGWFSYSIIPTNGIAGKQIFSGMNQPGEQSVGFYISPLKRVAFLNGTNITVYNPADGLADENKSFALQPLNANTVAPEELVTGYNTSTAVYTGKKGYEIGLLNQTGNQVELYDISTGKCTGVANVPAEDIPENTLFNFSYSNDYFWFFNKTSRKWTGYKLKIEKPSVAKNISDAAPAIVPATNSKASALFTEALNMKDANNYTGAINKLQECLKADAAYPDANYQLAWCYNETSNFPKAIEAATKGIAVNSNDSKCYQEKGYALKQTGKYQDAITSYQKALAINPNASTALKDIGDTYVAMDQSEQAYTYYKKCLAIDPANAGANFEVAYYFNQKEQNADALPYAKAAVQESGSSALYLNELGYTYYKLKMNDDAIDAYTRSAAADNTQGTAYKGLGDIYRVNYNPAKVTEAISNYEKAVANDPKSMGSAYGLGWCYNNQQRYDDAIRVMEKALTVNSKYTLILTELGYSYYAKQNYTAALKNLNNSIASDNKQRLAYYYAGLCYCGQKDRTSATNAYNKLVPLDSGLAQTLLEYINKL